MVVSCIFSMKNNSTMNVRSPVLNLSVGQNFRATPYNPAREGRDDEGPVFASVSLLTGRSQGSFLLSTGPRSFSGEFQADTDAEGFMEFPLTLAFNSGKEPASFESPSGPDTIPPGTFSAWRGTEKVWADQAVGAPDVPLDNFSFGLGKGTDASGDEGAAYDGIYRLKNIRVLAEQK